MDAACVEFPYDLKAEFDRGRIKVHATFDGEPYDGSIVNMGVKRPTARCAISSSSQGHPRKKRQAAGRPGKSDSKKKTVTGQGES